MGERGEELPPLDFIGFLISLASSAEVHLGRMSNPTNERIEKKLTLAKQTIDILGILQEKTKGNLTPEENQLLERMLFDLRMQYIEETQSKGLVEE